MKKRKIHWGVHWGKVASGGSTLAVFGTIAWLMYLQGYFAVWPIALAVVGLFVLILGLAGEQGIW